MNRDELIIQVGGHLHADQHIDAGRLIASFSGANPRAVDKQEVALEWNNSLLFYCLNNNRYEDAAGLLWGKNLFDPRPRATKMVWEALRTTSLSMFMGAASQSKSYSGGVWLLLDWIRDPEFTNVALVGPSENHLKDNLFTHLVSLHNASTLPLPGIIGDLFIGLDTKNRKGAITGIVIPLGKRPAGRLQGRKRVPRKVAHPTLGLMSRSRFFLDEMEKIPLGVWKDVDNLAGTLTTDIDAVKIMGAFNPEDPTGQVALRCEPTKGWEHFDADADQQWTSKRGWNVVRLDAAKSENVLEKKEIFPGLQTYEGFQRIITNSGGTDTPGYWTMARACFPKGGATFSVLPSTLLTRTRGEFMFSEEPDIVAGGDLALEGGDTAELAVGRFGRAVGVRYPASFDHPKGREVIFKDRNNQTRFRWALQVDQIFPLPKGDTVKMAEEIKSACQKLKIKPGHLMLDRTGNGAGVHDFLKSLWSDEVRGVNYMQSATEKKILEDDTKTAKEEYERIVSELWFALKKWAEFNFIRIKPSAFTDELAKELEGRRYASGKLTKVETKDEYQSRGNSSPNKADALTLLLHGVRVAFNIAPNSLDDMAGITNASSGLDPRAPVPMLTDVTSSQDSLEGNSTGDWMT